MNIYIGLLKLNMAKIFDAIFFGPRLPGTTLKVFGGGWVGGG